MVMYKSTPKSLYLLDKSITQTKASSLIRLSKNHIKERFLLFKTYKD